MCDLLIDFWQGNVQDELVEIQPNFKTQLLAAVEAFDIDVTDYEKEYNEVSYWSLHMISVRLIVIWLINFTVVDVDWEIKDVRYLQVGPMVDGIAPQEASDRLNVFQVCSSVALSVICACNVALCIVICTCLSTVQSRFDELWRKFSTYSAGEELFGLMVTGYPNLTRMKKELNLLQKLYGLFNTVMVSINGYYDILWAEVDIEKINNELLDFQNRYMYDYNLRRRKWGYR